MMTSSKWQDFREEDRAFFERELASFVPDRVFDAHAHLFHPDSSKSPKGMPATIGVEQYRQMMDCLLPGRNLASLFISFTLDSAKAARSNEWVAQNLAHSRDCRGLFLAKPDDDPEWVRQEVRRLGLHGLKCYHLQAKTNPTWQADIPDYLPEPMVKVAHEEGWAIVLHMVKQRAVADPANIHWIRHYCQSYPGMKLILAHSARGFQPSHNLEGLPELVGLGNLYFDSSANCEPMAHQVIIRLFGHRKLMYGSDFPVSHLRGRSLGVADTFIWLYAETPVWNAKHENIQPVLIGLENLRSLKWACWSAGLDDSQIEDIFWNNAVELLGIR